MKMVIKYEKSPVVKGYTDRLLVIDLGAMTADVREIPAETRSMYVGGRGYCLKLVYDGTTAATRHDSPENVLAMAGGPYCGEVAYVGTGKFIVGTISPLTDTFCDSNVGGHFFPLVKLSGFDAIAVTGRTAEETAVFIDGDAGTVSFTAAPEGNGGLRGAEEIIEKFTGDGKRRNVAFVTAGVGAVNTHIGCVNSVYYDSARKRCRAKQAGRGGTGSVMRGKGLWGIIVKCNAPKENAAVDKERLQKVGRKLRDVIKEVDPKAMSLGTQGTTSLMDMMNAVHLLPVNNYQYGCDEREKNVSGSVFEKKIFAQNRADGCYPGCNLGCTKGCEKFTPKTGPQAGVEVSVDGPEYETAAAVTNLGVFDLDAMMEYTWYTDEYGIDSISVGVIMSFLIEAFERGYLTAEDTGGRELKWNDPAMMLSLLHDVANARDEFTREAGKGIRRMKSWIADRAAARMKKSKEEIIAELSLFGMECKGLEFSMYITKESLAQQGGYGMALKGPQHDEAWLIAIDQLHKELPGFRMKAVALKWFPLFRTWFNIAGLCKLPWIDVRHPEARNTQLPYRNMPTVEYYVEMVNATFGTDKTIDDLLFESERCYTLHKLINLRRGFGTRRLDYIPLRAMSPVYMNEYESRREYYEKYLSETAGVDIAGKSDEERMRLLQNFRRERYESLLDAVYEEKGYDRNGIPTDELLKRLGMDSPEFMKIIGEARLRENGAGD